MQETTARVLDPSRIAGIGLCGAAAATVLAMSYHPTDLHGSADGGDFVHGTMIVLLAVTAVGLFHFAQRRGMDRLWILAGVVAYAISLGAHVGAATLNGFVAPALAARGPGAMGHDTLLLVWETNQALARHGVYATGAAFALWSYDFLLRAGTMNRLAGAFGMLAGVLPAAAIFTGILTMNVHGALAIYAAHAAWVALVGVQLIRRAE
ncbi:MAG: hypothetical protein KF822_02900 [Steroidobacteraceae bacterium]|nr:hypothetical protein [Steroidobacteraceae bacterium]